eukprot:CAMPEP_0181190538 /NCGR_PEP_ID=MMETSP1096-20121128/12247_2 /TAXON_ID=156174 ORGANISM="Chrysochromulina ericina, Strain CCMP281" /NCGR_SAMPLE_ID=MMETSP1096 /ASSEMBLY_ACC=CAM_ASM_000453 /LENGTH=61 /DNA_ID=CAMNT_0023279761 /DNA_START=533 /DNA_END=715 /DNA_ORIENTATION=-
MEWLYATADFTADSRCASGVQPKHCWKQLEWYGCSLEQRTVGGSKLVAPRAVGEKKRSHAR